MNLNEANGVRPFIQQLDRLVTFGYCYFFVVKQGNEAKKEQLIDKLKHKFDLPISKDQAYRQKLKGKARYQILSYGDAIVVLRTKGTAHVNDDEKWERKISFSISETTHISLTGSRVKIGSYTMKRLNEKLHFYAKHQNKKMMWTALKKHLGLVCTKSTFEQYLNAVKTAQKLSEQYGFPFDFPKAPKPKFEKVF